MPAGRGIVGSRGGSELLYNPIPVAEKRATKAIIDVGFDRLGDLVGAGLVLLVLALHVGWTTAALLALVVAFALATLALVARLSHGYVASLEAGLVAEAEGLESVELPDWTGARTLYGTGSGVAVGPVHPGAEPRTTGPGDATAQASRPRAGTGPPGADATPLDDLRSGDPARVRAVLARTPALDPVLVPEAIGLLAWDEVARDAILALRRVSQADPGPLVDALLDPGTGFTVRRRLPAALAGCTASRAVEGLIEGLRDGRFEVRYRCGRVLARMRASDPGWRIEPDLVFDIVRREARVERSMWNSRRLLEQMEDTPEAQAPFDAVVRERAGRSLEHVFTLLALVLPVEPLGIAFRGLQTGDPALRGLALEYLDSVLPDAVKAVLWKHLEERAPEAGMPVTRRQREAVLEALMRSHVSIEAALERARHR